MGCVFSQEFKVREEIPGQDSLALETFRRLHLSKKDIDILFTAFCDMDADNSHYIRRDEFCDYFHLELTPLTVRMVKMMDPQHKGCLNFCEMVGLLWDFLSRDPHSLGSFAFYLFDKKNNDTLSRKEVTELVESLHHTKSAKHKGVSKIVHDMMNYSLDIDVESFHKYCKNHDEVCLLLVGLQNSLRERILGTHVWDSIMYLRNVGTGQREATYIQALYAEMASARAMQAKLKKKMSFERKRIENRAKKSVKKRRSSLMQFVFESDKKHRCKHHPEAFTEKYEPSRIPSKQRVPRRKQSLLLSAPVLVHRVPNKRTVDLRWPKKRPKKHHNKVVVVSEIPEEQPPSPARSHYHPGHHHHHSHASHGREAATKLE
eukprot:CAMPEP_0114437424 /NCGR_PEP_ID=MMETSP0103-20121206/14005_1 /TAXON_ID=37642 ORGANISM="Paraphysomonas imperforata, Strain PA2" /NCGR_SAMPLE_ID=MMETSP0103 /ASSEMBLY_ACC=CAM_ASM_000201 /LENGTH=373 /DNA_ID=CAMNT_0001607813 /DNA_START=220 /DNA_END=1338 /DNA_ORIENTATION=+